MLSMFKDITPKFNPSFSLCLAPILSTPLIAFSNILPWSRGGKQFYAAHSNQLQLGASLNNPIENGILVDGQQKAS